MRIRQKYKAVAPTHGETRIRKRFAWKPVTIGDMVLWLGFYKTLEAYIVNKYAVKVAQEDGQIKEKAALIGKWQEIDKQL